MDRGFSSRMDLQSESGRKLAEVVNEILEERDRFMNQMASKLSRPLNNHLKTITQNSLSEKRDAVMFINHLLDGLGFAIRCPNSGLPTRLEVCVLPYHENGKYRLLEIPSSTKRRHYTQRSTFLADLELTLRPSKAVALSNWISMLGDDVRRDFER